MKFFKLNGLKRIIILLVTIFATLLTIILGSVFFVIPNSKLGLDYGGGVEFVVEINVQEAGSDDFEESNKIANDVAESIYERINALDVVGATVEAEIRDGENATIRVQYPGITSTVDRDRIEQLIITKPKLTLTDIYGNRIFNHSGRFNTALSGDPGNWLEDPEDVDYAKDSQAPIKNGGAEAMHTNDGSWQVKIELDSIQAGLEWTKATSYVASLPDGKNVIPIWIDLNEFIDIAKNDWSFEWNKAGHNPFLFAHVDENFENILKKYQIDSEQYVVSSPRVTSALVGTDFVIDGNFTQQEAQLLARRINYGVSNYTLSTISSNFVDPIYGSNAFTRAMIAGMIVFAFIAVFLIFNYGVLGLLSTVSISLFMFLTLLMFATLNGKFSPEMIGSLIIGIGMSVDANIITFERFKGELYSGSSLRKANLKSSRKSLTTIFDSNVTTMIVAFVLFYFGTRAIVGLSVTLVLSIFFTLVVMLAFTRFTSSLLVRSGYFDKRLSMLGVRPKADQNIQSKINRYDYMHGAKLLSKVSGGIVAIAAVVMSIFIGISGSFGGGFNLSQEFRGGNIVQVSALNRSVLNASEVNEIRSDLLLAGVNSDEIEYIYEDATKTEVREVRVKSDRDLDITEIKRLIDTGRFNLYTSNTTVAVATRLVREAIIAIAIAFALIVVYTLIRFRWTFAFSAVVALVHDGLIVTAVFILTRVEVSPVFIAGLLAIIGYSINDTIVTFDRVREKMSSYAGQLTEEKIVKIANDAIRDTFKRSLLTSFTTIVAVLILMSFGNATRFSFNLAMLSGLIVGTYSSIFIATYVWTKLEIFRLRRQKRRAKSNFWKIDEIEEQVFAGINDFKI